MSEFAEALEEMVWAQLRKVNTILPGRVEKWDWDRARADVLPLLRERINGRDVARAVVPDVRVGFPMGGTASLSFPVVRGDVGILFFCQRSLDEWLQKGGSVLPADRRVFDQSDAFFLPWFRPFSTETPAQDATSLVLRNGAAKLRMDGDRVAVGNASGEVLDLLSQALEALSTTTVLTSLGPQPLSSAASLASLRSTLELNRGSL
jgi:hypothetical protein